jgi:hypothetical protein
MGNRIVPPRIAAMIVVLLIGGGCASAKSTMLARDEGNSSWTHSKVNGYPITVKVPTHLRLTIYEKFYVAAQPAPEPAAPAEAPAAAPDTPATNPVEPPAPAPSGGPGLSRAIEPNGKVVQVEATYPDDSPATPEEPKPVANTPATATPVSRSPKPMHKVITDGSGQMVTSLDFTTQLIETEKIFTVDQKRPAAGTLNYRTNMKDQSIRQIQSKAADDTIQQIGVAVGGFIALFTGGPAPATLPLSTVSPLDPVGTLSDAARPVRAEETMTDTNKISENVISLQRVLATRVFDLADPDLELQVMEFLQSTVNACGHP